MSIVIDFVETSRGATVLPNGEAVDLSSASSVEIQFSLFMGDLVLQSTETDLSTRFGFISMFNLLTGLPEAFSKAMTTAEGVLYFYEHDQKLTMRRSGDCILITCNYASRRIRVDVKDLAVALLDFVHRRTTMLIEQYPELLKNPSFLDMIFKG
ncbi:hypothetical protein GCM10023085_06220 [Actinomadura viridis]|uniref:Uncharacterized protein n=1 Tax=Actinomadura viridis TaxID=58110 RepID=A0A931GT65_9ACTN|nr:hypothetical protein [Actinomadura viridis]MBG6091639.1 hypothetical protein [Actinomadura viridis]